MLSRRDLSGTFWCVKCNAKPYTIPSSSAVEELIGSFPDSHMGRSFASYINTSKERLDTHSGKAFTDVRTKSDPLYKLTSTLQRRFGAPQHCNRGWLKMFELVSTHSLMGDVPAMGSKPRIVKALYNCEFPGGFILASNHYALTNDIEFHWWASSLHPSTDKDALKDSFKLFENFPAKWLMSPTPNANGDMTSLPCINTLEEESKRVLKSAFPFEKTKFDLYVADGGMDIHEKYKLQEELHQAGEFLTCIRCLRRGGNGVIKMYTTLTDFMRSLLLVAVSMFSEAYMCKPYTSRLSNTEVYLVLKKYNGKSPGLLKHLEKRLPDVKTSSEEGTAARSLVNMADPSVAPFNTLCFYMTDKTSELMTTQLDELLKRLNNTREQQREWASMKLGTVDSQEWIKIMQVKHLEESKNLR